MTAGTRRIRVLVQSAFLALVLLIGLEFHFFVQALLDGGALPRRPPGVEGFLPISSLMSLRLLAQTGEVHPAHPAGLFILLGALAMSFTAPKSFCGWLCPFGFLSEVVHGLRRRLTPSFRYPPAWLHYPLSALKYLLLGFFAWAIFASMDLGSLRDFLDGDYNLIADAKMYFFFADITPLAAGVIAALLALSFAVPFFWCRYLCPYGALLVPVSLAGPLRIRRDPAACAACGRCARACPQGIAVDRATAVRSENCVSCARCLDACPAPGALEFRDRGGRLRVRPAFLPLLTALVFFLVIWLAMAAGNWESRVPPEEYRRLVPLHDTLGHPGV
ncbi:MAG: 4Fe-4S binding protein [Elusimicrobiales bacterium]|jgi:polyferredoxin|nr:4Fe-4S binding protein [Elusimicrobiales bacterium]